MANVKVTLDYQINDGMSLTFKAPCDCTAVTGLKIYYPSLTEDASTTTSKTFTFKDAHGNNLANIGNLFTTGAYVKVILDTTNNAAYIQNADTNGYLEDKFSTVATTNNGTVTSVNADYAEVGEWADGNTSDEDRIGYFVAVDTSTAGTTMVKATSTMDVRGVTVTAPAFSGNFTSDKFDSDGNLLKQYDFVAVMGLVSVIDNGTCTINGRCMPNDSGTAVPSTNNLGYHVIERIDSTHILIAVEPGADMIQRIKTDMGRKADLDSSGKVPTSQLPEISSVKTYTGTIGTTWTENEDTGVKSQSVAISGVLAKHTAKVDHAYTGSGTSDDYAAFVEAENQYLTYITNGYAETYDGGITFYIFGDAPTVSIPIVVEVA